MRWCLRRERRYPSLMRCSNRRRRRGLARWWFAGGGAEGERDDENYLGGSVGVDAGDEARGEGADCWKVAGKSSGVCEKRVGIGPEPRRIRHVQNPTEGEISGDDDFVAGRAEFKIQARGRT